MVVHPIPNPGFVPDAQDPALPRLIRDAVPRSLDDLVPAAEEAGIRMTLENLPYKCDYPLLTVEELRPLVDGYPRDQVGLVVDTGHVGVHRMDPVAEIRAAGERLHGTHLHDVDFSQPDADHRAPTHGGLDWNAILGALSEVGYAGPWTFEVAVPSHDESPEELARITREVATDWGL
jgi:sugar phosphate isomerase/epimerase